MQEYEGDHKSIKREFTFQNNSKNPTNLCMCYLLFCCCQSLHVCAYGFVTLNDIPFSNVQCYFFNDKKKKVKNLTLTLASLLLFLYSFCCYLYLKIKFKKKKFYKDKKTKKKNHPRTLTNMQKMSQGLMTFCYYYNNNNNNKKINNKSKYYFTLWGVLKATQVKREKKRNKKKLQKSRILLTLRRSLTRQQQ